MKALILAAGYGTRMYPLIKDTPKAMLDINGRPLIEYIMDRLSVIKTLNEIVIVTNNKFYANFKEWAEDLGDSNMTIKVLNDGSTSPEERLGSIGDIAFAINKAGIKEDLLIVGSDNIFDFNVEEYIAFADDKAPSVSIGLYDIHDLSEAHKYGVVSIANDGKITSFEEKPENPKSTLISMCFYYLPAASLGLIGEYLNATSKSDKAGDYIQWLIRDNDVFGFNFEGKWYDIGSIETYEEAKNRFTLD